MKKLLSLTVLSILVIFGAVGPVSAARPTKPGGGGSTVDLVGNDISWPQCGKSLPTTHAFGIVGVNGGKASTTNPCLSTQLEWAHSAIGGTTQPKAQLYVNTANPGQVIDQVDTWPASNVDQKGFTPVNPYGDCTGENDMACSWQYGWNRSVYTFNDAFLPAASTAGVTSNIEDYVWWLDVETMNSWQAGSTEALAKNAAALEGMAKYYQDKNAKVGIYSTNYQWGVIVGNTVANGSNLNVLDSWLAGARSLKGAKANCANPALTSGGHVTITQYVSGSLDYDYSCVK